MLVRRERRDSNVGVEAVMAMASSVCICVCVGCVW